MARNTDTFDGDIAEGLAALRNDLATLTKTVGGFVQQQAETAGQSLSDTAGEARDQVTRVAADAQKQVKSMGADIEASIERHPMTALLVIFGMGMSLGLLSRSRG